MRDWEACYRTGETPWDKGGAAPPLLELIDRFGSELWGRGTILVPGCGLGHDVRALSALGLPVQGVDISQTATERAREIPAVSAESYETGDFLDPMWVSGRRYSAIWEHTCFCAILPSQREAYAASVAALLAPGDVFAGVFYLTPNDPGDDETGPPFNVSIEELDGWFSKCFERIEGWVPDTAYPGRQGREWLAVYRRLSERE